MRLTKYAAIGALSASMLILGGCGGGGGGDDTSLPTTSNATSTGVFVDAPVANLNYECTPSGSSGVTNSQGEFSYAPGDSCSFSAGNIPLGTVAAQLIVTPKDLFGLNDFNDTRVLSMAALLWALDSDNNVTNGIDINTTLATSITLNVTDPDELFSDDDNDGNVTIVELIANYFEDLAKEIDDLYEYNSTLLITHLEESEIEAEYEYSGTLTAVQLSRDNFKDKTYSVDGGDAYLSFDSNSTYIEKDEYGNVTATGSWTVIDDYLVLNSSNYSAYVAFTELEPTSAKYIAFVNADDDVDAGSSYIMDYNSTGPDLNPNSVAITFGDLADKTLQTPDGKTLEFYPDGSYKISDPSGTYTGSWTVVDDHVITMVNEAPLTGVNKNIVTYITFADANLTEAYYFADNTAGMASGITSADLNSTLTYANVDNRIPLSKTLLGDKVFTLDDGTVFTLKADGEYKEENSAGDKVEGSWTIVDNYLVVLIDDNGANNILYVAFESFDGSTAEATVFSAYGVFNLRATNVSDYIDD